MVGYAHTHLSNEEETLHSDDLGIQSMKCFP